MGNVIIAPDADDTDGNWTTQVGGTSLFAVIDEAAADDADYIKSGPDPTGDVCKIRLSNPTQVMLDPMKVSVRYRKQVSTQRVDLTIRLVEGTTTRAEWTVSDIADTWTTATNTLSAPERAAITDFTNLYVELEAAVAGQPLLDIYPTATCAYSLRLLRAAYAGSAVRIRESGGNTEQDIGFTVDGDFDASAAATFIGANTGYIVKWYDQSGNGLDVSTATADQQPSYAATPSRAVFASTMADGFKTAVNAPTVNQPLIASTVFRRNSSAAGGPILVAYPGGGGYVMVPLKCSTNVVGVYLDNDFLATAADNAWHTAQTLCYDQSSIICVDGSNTTGGNPGVRGITANGPLAIGYDGYGGHMNGDICEIIVWAGDLRANFPGLDSNQAAYYGI